VAIYVYVGVSLDGFIAAADGDLDWLNEIPNPDESDYGFAEFISSIDAIVMGRNTFEKVLTFDSWPYEKPVFVLSNSLKDVPQSLGTKAEIVSGPLRALVSQLRERGFAHLYVDGGIVIQSFLEEDLVDEMILTRIPILLGAGVPLFGGLTKRLWFKHDRTEALNETLVKSYYKRVRE
jgi:dihydrofolate reductase